MELMITKKIRHLPVLENEVVVGTLWEMSRLLKFKNDY
jgi:predicted transcriptional regulator